MTGMVFDIQKFSIHDGPGIRTTVFLKGCPLRCAWCHNPESQSGKPVISYRAEACLQCGACTEACPENAHRVQKGSHAYNRMKCTGCGACSDACPSGALETVGKTMSVPDVMKEILKDREFYSGEGGLTVSGGEPLAQAGFTTDLLKTAKKAGLNTAVETSGYGPAAVLIKMIPVTDLFLFDLKAAAKDHESLTGVSRRTILANLEMLLKAGAKIRLRIPLVSGMNVSSGFLEEILSLLKEMPDIDSVEIMPYHSLASGKYTRFGLQDTSGMARVPSGNLLQQWQNAFMSAGKKVLYYNR